MAAKINKLLIQSNFKKALSLVGFLNLFPLFMVMEICYFLFSLWDQETRGKYILDKICFCQHADIELRMKAEKMTKECQDDK